MHIRCFSGLECQVTGTEPRLTISNNSHTIKDVYEPSK